MPKGAFYVFPNVSGLFGKRWKGGTLKGSADVCAFLLDEARELAPVDVGLRSEMEHDLGPDGAEHLDGGLLLFVPALAWKAAPAPDDTTSGIIPATSAIVVPTRIGAVFQIGRPSSTS